MKKFLVVLLSLGLIAAFAATASAQPSQFMGTYMIGPSVSPQTNPTMVFSAQYYLTGVYDNNPTLTKDNGFSRAVFHTRLRLSPIFRVVDGLTLTTRMDVLEKNWGDINWRGATGYTDGDQASSRGVDAAAGNASKVQESIEWERAYVTFNTAIGRFDVGYQNADGWGTQFCDAAVTRPRISLTNTMGPLTFGVVYEKWVEADGSGAGVTNNDGKVDADMDTYAAYGIFKFTGGEAGLLYKYYNNASQRTVANTATTAAYRQTVSMVSPYFKTAVGPVYVEGEVDYWFGKVAKYEDLAAVNANFQDVTMDSLNAYILAKMNMGPAYFGGQFAYMTGNDASDPTKVKEAPNGKNTTWSPLVILGGSDRNDWLGGRGIGGGVGGNTLASITNKVANWTVGTLFAGVSPTPKTNIEAVIGTAWASKKPWRTVSTIPAPLAGNPATEYSSDKMGWEVDLKATYKIYDNLSYYVAAGYLFTGDFWKRDSATATVGDEYVLMNKLQLDF